nr:beta-ketoacyl synthase N-terminal-like domain-containing protein [Micromonospora sp. DSM 115978]
MSKNHVTDLGKFAGRHLSVMPGEGTDDEVLAIVGIGCRLPGQISSPESLWRVLTSGTDAVTEIPADRWDADAYYDPEPSVPGRMCSRWGGFIDDVGGFDAEFFAITRNEAVAMDPQQR